MKPPVGGIGVTEKGTTSVELASRARRQRRRRPATARRPASPVRSCASRGPLPRLGTRADAGALRRIAPHAPLPLRPLLSRADRLAPAVTRALLAAGPDAAAMTRTTVAATTLSGSPALNVIASTAKAGLNVRVMVGDTVAGVVDHLRSAIKDDGHPHRRHRVGRAAPVSPMDGAFGLIESCIGEVFADAVPTPYVMMAATDSRHFTAICERVYRFAPFRMTKAQRQAIHSYDEHLGDSALVDGVRWYRTLIERLPA